jgi:hypothetical protein
MKMNSRTVSSIVIGTCLLSLVSCGSDGGSNNSSSNPQTREEQQQLDDQGIYRAVLQPLNTNVSGNTTGTVEITVSGDEIVFKSNVRGAPAGVKHLQNIMLANNCPAGSSDLNGDSFVDIVEAIPATGPYYIPVDSDLSGQIEGMTYGPIANTAGNYSYRRSTSLTLLLADLHTPDPDMTDSLVKIPLEQDLNLEGKVVLVHGVAASKDLPDSVASLNEIPSELTLPIACGKLVRVESEETVPAEAVEDAATETF